MPRYKLSPEERASEKERKENLRNIMKGLDVKSFGDIDDRLVELQERDVALIRPRIIHSTSEGGYRRRLMLFRDSYLHRYFTRHAAEVMIQCFDHSKIQLNGSNYLQSIQACDKLQKAPEIFWRLRK